MEDIRSSNGECDDFPVIFDFYIPFGPYVAVDCCARQLVRLHCWMFCIYEHVNDYGYLFAISLYVPRVQGR